MELARYVDDKRAQVASLLAGEEPAPHLENAEYLLLDEAEAVLARAGHVYLWPCDCRSLMERCRKPSLVCLRFENDRGLGWEISQERALAVLRDADRHGLMHTGEVTVGDEPLTRGAICNCCADCCFPQLAGEALGAARLWPRVRYVARARRRWLHLVRPLRTALPVRRRSRCPRAAAGTAPGSRPRLLRSSRGYAAAAACARPAARPALSP